MENQENKNQNNPGQNRKDLKRPKKILDDGQKFNYFWVYAIILLFVMMFFGNLSFFQENVKESTMTQLRSMLTNNDVDKIIIATGAEKSAEIYLKESALNKPEYKDV